MTKKGVKCQGNFKIGGLFGLPVGPWAGGEKLGFSTNHQLPQLKEKINLEMLQFLLHTGPINEIKSHLTFFITELVVHVFSYQSQVHFHH